MFQITPHYDTFSVYDPFMTEWMNLSHVGIMNLPTYIVGTIAIILLPGPNSLYVLTISSQTNWRSGVWGAFGIVVGDSISDQGGKGWDSQCAQECAAEVPGYCQ